VLASSLPWPDSPWFNSRRHSTGDPSPLAALLLHRILARYSQSSRLAIAAPVSVRRREVHHRLLSLEPASRMAGIKKHNRKSQIGNHQAIEHH
jgi:hypothetical protein